MFSTADLHPRSYARGVPGAAEGRKKAAERKEEKGDDRGGKEGGGSEVRGVKEKCGEGRGKEGVRWNARGKKGCETAREDGVQTADGEGGIF